MTRGKGWLGGLYVGLDRAVLRTLGESWGCYPAFRVRSRSPQKCDKETQLGYNPARAAALHLAVKRRNHPSSLARGFCGTFSVPVPIL